MDIQQLRYFVGAARSRSFREAADALYISRATLSKSMARLEAEVGQPLFERARDGVALTSFGHRFLAEASPVVDGYERLDALVKGARSTIEITVCIPNSWAEYFAEAIAGFEARNPGVCVAVVSAPDAECNRRAQEGQADVVVSHLPLANMLDPGIDLVSTPSYVAMSDRNPLAAKEFIEPDDLADQTLFYYACGYEKVFWVPTHCARTEVHGNDLMRIYACLFRNEGVMFTPLLTAPVYQQGITYRPYRGPYDIVVMRGYVTVRPGRRPEVERLCLALREALIMAS